MAGIYINFNENNHSRCTASLNYMKFFDEEHSEIISLDKVSIVWSSHDPPELFAPAFDPETGICVVTFGRVSWDESEWQEAEKLNSFTGGLSCKLLLRDYLKQGITAIERPNGPAVVALWDPRDKKLHLVTDHFGYQPAFFYKPEDVGQCVISTHPDVIANDTSVHVTPDKISMAEYLSAWRITPPHTYYNEIKYAGAATICTWDVRNNTFSKREYWTPDFSAPASSFSSMVEQLEHAVRESIRKRTLPRLSPVTILVSGGMDSRNMLFSCASKETAVGVNMYVNPSRETKISHELCDIAGVRYVGVPLRDDYYPKWSKLAVKLSGGMNLLEDNHYLGIRDIIQQAGTKTIISACTADWLFKGYGLDKTYMMFMGRPLPVYKFLDQRNPGFPPNEPKPVSDKFTSAIKQRYDEWYAGCPQKLKTEADRLLCEDKRIRPACYAVSISGPIMYRAFPYDTFFGDRLIADCYGKMKASWKLNSRVWGEAAKRICSGAEHIVDSNWGAPMGASVAHKIFVFGLGWIQRKFQKKTQHIKSDGVSIESGGSWPYMGWYAIHSDTIKSLWGSTQENNKEIITELLGYNPWDISLEDWSHRPAEFFRIVAMLLRCS